MADLGEAIVEGAGRRVRPIIMTVGTTIIALLPIMLGTGTGADVMKRVAAPMVGGLVTATVLSLAVVPAIFSLWKGWEIWWAGRGADVDSSEETSRWEH